MSVRTNDVEELVVKNGNGGNGDVLTKKMDSPTRERVAFAKGMKRLPLELVERYESILEAYAAKLQDRIDLNIKKAVQLAEQGPEIESAEPYSGVTYKWWDLFLVGPFQAITAPPFLPHKVIAAGEPAFFLAFVVKNPLPTPGPGPSALTILNGRPFNLNAEMVNLTTVTDGPDIAIASAFSSAVVQAYLLVFIAPTPLQGKPDLYEINVTLDVNDPFLQPIAGFATTIIDVDTDPGFPTFPPSGPHVHVEQPMRFLVYRP